MLLRPEYLSRKLDRPIPTKDGGTLRTIREDDDFDVLADGVVVGRIFKANASPVGASWCGENPNSLALCHLLIVGGAGRHSE